MFILSYQQIQPYKLRWSMLYASILVTIKYKRIQPFSPKHIS